MKQYRTHLSASKSYFVIRIVYKLVVIPFAFFSHMMRSIGSREHLSLWESCGVTSVPAELLMGIWPLTLLFWPLVNIRIVTDWWPRASPIVSLCGIGLHFCFLHHPFPWPYFTAQRWRRRLPIGQLSVRGLLGGRVQHQINFISSRARAPKSTEDDFFIRWCQSMVNEKSF